MHDLEQPYVIRQLPIMVFGYRRVVNKRVASGSNQSSTPHGLVFKCIQSMLKITSIGHAAEETTLVIAIATKDLRCSRYSMLELD